MKHPALSPLTLLCLLMMLFSAPSAKAQGVRDLVSAILGAAVEQVTGITDAAEAAADQQNLAQWKIPAGNYSGITPLETAVRAADGTVSCRYAVVSDKGSSDGFFVWRIVQDGLDGHVVEVVNEGFRANKVSATSGRDCEGVVFVPRSGTLFISGEGDGRVLEYDLKGQRTGRELEVPAVFRTAVGNQGLEALAYGGKKPLFWLTSETMLKADKETMLKADKATDGGTAGTMNLLRIVSFGADLKAERQWAYQMDPAAVRTPGSIYAFGVPELCALPDGRLLVLEREANVTSAYVGSTVSCRLYSVSPKKSRRLRSDRPLSELGERAFLRKKLVDSWTTSLSLAGINWANYEGMCLGATLSDGRRTLILVSDSQGGYGKAGFNLADFVKVIVVK